MSNATRWWVRQSTSRKGIMLGGAAVLVIGAGAAANGQGDANNAAAPTTTTENIIQASLTTDVAPTTAPATTVAETTPPTTPPTTLAVSYNVAHVVDGDTIDAVPSDGSPVVTVRLIGIDTPEAGVCGADAATWSLASIINGQTVTLTPGADGEDADRYGRLLRYVDVAGVDAGLRLLQDGMAVARYDSRDGYGRHDREDAYVAADGESNAYECPPPTTQAPPRPPPPAPVFAAPQQSGSCDSNYTGCVPIDSDVDCAGGSGNGPSYTGYVQVIGADIYGLDRDGDGEACE